MLSIKNICGSLPQRPENAERLRASMHGHGQRRRGGAALCYTLALLLWVGAPAALSAQTAPVAPAAAVASAHPVATEAG
jgi:hypothetical protein